MQVLRSLESPASFLDACGLTGSLMAQTSLLMAADRCCRPNRLDAFFKTKHVQKASVRALSSRFSDLPFFSLVRGPDWKSLVSGPGCPTVSRPVAHCHKELATGFLSMLSLGSVKS